MSNDERPIAIIPARGGSRRIPRKNIVDMDGQPMMTYPIQTALRSELFSQVVVSTEDAEIAEIALAYGAEVVHRPVSLATDTAPEIEVYRQALDALRCAPEHFCAIYSTAVLITPEDLKQSYSMLRDQRRLDVVMGVSRYSIHPFKALSEDDEGFLEMVYPKECLERSQTYPSYVASNGTFYWFRTSSYTRNPTYYPSRLKGYLVPRHRALDIDEPDDLVMAHERLLSRPPDR